MDDLLGGYSVYIYDEIDQRLVDERVAQFRDQTGRFLAGKLSEDDFRPVRLQNGLYIQRHAPMLRIAIPYGLLASRQLRALAHVTRTYDRGTGHFSTRQNLQLNWPRLEDVPEILATLATVQMHAIQTSGNCVRNITSDHFAGIAPDEIVDPLVWCEIVRQWSTFNPEFAYLPRKFKIAIAGAAEDRAAIQVHDVGLQAVKDDAGEIGFRVLAGGGLGRTPILGAVIRDFLPWQHLLTYLEAILRVYNRYGRRDNKWKARIKILVKDLTPAGFRDQVEAEWQQIRDGDATLTSAEVDRVTRRFTRPTYEKLEPLSSGYVLALGRDKAFASWVRRNVHPHKVPGYAAVTLSLKRTGVPPGDATAEQMDAVADLAERYGFGELRVTHEQNLLLPDVRQSELFRLWQEARGLDLATANVGMITNIISCPGGDYCSLANAKSIPVAEAIQRRFDDLDYVYDIGELDLNISGCMNSCGHHHIGHIGILGVDKQGAEYYQISIGGAQGNAASLGKVLGPSVSQDEVPDVVEKLIQVYLKQRDSDAERFVDVVRRIGTEPFKEHVYGAHQGPKARARQLAAA
ncbi:MAG: sulfite reductase [Betaproteobacteria bacterium]|jgi:sulfite reductase (NADPH) hemoprotein beta-component|nr:sulfite reductase [Betaproteobacteria bacterium]